MSRNKRAGRKADKTERQEFIRQRCARSLVPGERTGTKSQNRGSRREAKKGWSVEQVLEEDHRAWSELTVWWQSTKHLNKNDEKTACQQKVKPLIPTHPPPYAPPSAPHTTGNDPTLIVSEGVIQIDSGDGRDLEEVRSQPDSIVSMQSEHTQYTPVLGPTPRKEAPTPHTDNLINLIELGQPRQQTTSTPTYDSSAPFKDRDYRKSWMRK